MKSIVAVVLGLLLTPLVFFTRDIEPAILEAKYATGASQFIEVQGKRVHYRDEGQGHPIVLIHGTSASLHTWDGWAAELKDKYRIVRFDLPAFGLTGASEPKDYSIDAYVEFVRAIVAQKGLTNFTLAGNSLGGWIAWMYAVKYPTDLHSLVLVDAAGYPRDEPPMLIKLGAWPVVGDLLPWITPRFLADGQVDTVYGDTHRIAPGVKDRYFELLLRPGNRRAFQQYARQIINTPDAHERIKSITVPTLVMWGDQDRLITAADATKFGEDITASQIVVYPGVGHIPMEEIPVQSAADVNTFVARNITEDKTVVPSSTK